MCTTQAIIMDWDGVIADSAPLFLDLYRHVCGHFGRPLPCRDLDEFRRWYLPRWEQNYLNLGFTEADLPKILDYAGQRICYDAVPLFAGAERAIRSLARDLPLAIASTTDSRAIRGRLAAAGLGDCFPVIVGGEDGGSDKIRRYRQAAAEVDADPQRCVAVGDTVLDVESSRHWGMRTVGVTYGWSAPDIVAAAAPDRLVDHPDALETVIRDLCRISAGEPPGQRS